MVTDKESEQILNSSDHWKHGSDITTISFINIKIVQKPIAYKLCDLPTLRAIYAHILNQHNISMSLSVFYIITCFLSGQKLCLSKVIFGWTSSKLVRKCLLSKRNFRLYIHNTPHRAFVSVCRPCNTLGRSAASYWPNLSSRLTSNTASDSPMAMDFVLTSGKSLKTVFRLHELVNSTVLLKAMPIWAT